MPKPGNVVDYPLNNMSIVRFPSGGMGKTKRMRQQHITKTSTTFGDDARLLERSSSLKLSISFCVKRPGRNEAGIERYNNNFATMNMVMRRMIFFPTKCLGTLAAPRAVGHASSISMLGELRCSGRRRRRNRDFGLHIFVALDLCRLNSFSPWDRFLVAQRPRHRRPHPRW